MDILFLSQYFHPEQFLNNHIARELVEQGHGVNVVCCVPNYPAGRFADGYSNFKRKRENWHGVNIHRVFTIPRGRSAIQLVANYLTYPIAASWRISRLGRKRGEISFVSMPSPLFQAIAGIFAKKLWRIPSVYWVQDIWPDSAIITLGIRNRLVVATLNAVCGWIYRQADLVMVQSDGFHPKIAEFGVAPDKIVTLPNSASAMFRPLTAAEIPAEIRSLIPPDRRVIMFAGNIGESQDFDTIIDGAKLLGDDNSMLFVIVGSGRDEDRVRQRVKSEGLDERFLFLGRHPEAAMPALFACADAMLVSLRDEQIFRLTIPSKVQAYMACGKPILASLAGQGAAVVAGAGAGLTSLPGDKQSFCKMIQAMSEMSDADLTKMGANARHAYVEQFALDAVLAKLIAHCENILSQRG
ncbi:MAG: glycosyltransferase family 4 protein [Sphingopyxis sp.]|nr:glycosyltransferase family 4 protein [Sphingopyxis sp.]